MDQMCQTKGLWANCSSPQHLRGQLQRSINILNLAALKPTFPIIHVEYFTREIAAFQR